MHGAQSHPRSPVPYSLSPGTLLVSLLRSTKRQSADPKQPSGRSECCGQDGCFNLSHLLCRALKSSWRVLPLISAPARPPYGAFWDAYRVLQSRAATMCSCVAAPVSRLRCTPFPNPPTPPSAIPASYKSGTHSAAPASYKYDDSASRQSRRLPQRYTKLLQYEEQSSQQRARHRRRVSHSCSVLPLSWSRRHHMLRTGRLSHIASVSSKDGTILVQADNPVSAITLSATPSPVLRTTLLILPPTIHRVSPPAQLSDQPALPISHQGGCRCAC
jgi:hypothetical protein